MDSGLLVEVLPDEVLLEELPDDGLLVALLPEEVEPDDVLPPDCGLLVELLPVLVPDAVLPDCGLDCEALSEVSLPAAVSLSASVLSLSLVSSSALSLIFLILYRINGLIILFVLGCGILPAAQAARLPHKISASSRAVILFFISYSSWLFLLYSTDSIPWEFPKSGGY